MSWNDIEVVAAEAGESFVIARPAYVIQGFGSDGTNGFGEELLDRWLEWAGKPTTLYYLSSSSRQYRQLVPRSQSRVRGDLRKAESNPVFYAIKDASGFDAGTSSLELRLGAHADDGLANVAYMAFPAAYPMSSGTETAVAAFVQLIKDVPFRHASAGFGFNMVWGREWEQEAMPRIMQVGRRYLGIDVRDRILERLLLSSVKGPSWLTFLGAELLEKVGGQTAIRMLPPNVGRIPAGDGVVLQAGSQPPVGDVNRRGRDLDALRAVGKLLREVRVSAWEMADIFEIDEDEANAWFARLDE